MVVFSALAYGTVRIWSLALMLLVGALILLLRIVDAWRSGSFILSRNTLQLPLLAFAGLGLVQLLPLAKSAADQSLLTGIDAARSLSRNPFATRFVVLQLLGVLVYFASALVFLRSENRQRKLVWTIIIFGVLFAVFGLVQSVVSPTTIYWIREIDNAYPFASFVNRSHFASYMLMTVGLASGLLLTRALHQELMIFAGFAVFVMSIALVLTTSRGAIISFVAELFFIALFTFKIQHDGRHALRVKDKVVPADDVGVSRAWRVTVVSRIVVLALLVAVLCSVVVWLGGAHSLERLVGTLNAENPTNSRIEFWTATLKMIGDHPVAGVGLGAYGVVYTGYDPANGTFRVDQAHNDYLQVLAEGGFAGAMIGLWFIVALFRKGFAGLHARDDFRRGTTSGALAGCFAVLLHSFVDFPLHALANALLFLMLAALATSDYKLNN